MSEKNTSDLQLGSGDAAEEALWETLAAVEREEPSGQLRQNFYRELARATEPGLLEKIRNMLGFSGNAGWLTATACALLGLAAGQLIGGADDSDNSRLVALEQNVSMLNRSLVLDRLQNNQPGKRLRGVMDASYMAPRDPDIALALLDVALNDRVASVRSAAIESLGAQINTPTIGVQLMQTLQDAESPLVQLALVDLVLRNGSDEQVGQLLQLAEDGTLHADLQRHVMTSLGRETT
jgi:hypothetical protein